jgi:hypothetical protein
VSTVNFALRSPAEQDALAAAYGRWLNSLTGPAQVLIRARRADLTGTRARLGSASGISFGIGYRYWRPRRSAVAGDGAQEFENEVGAVGEDVVSGVPVVHGEARIGLGAADGQGHR